MSNHLKPCPFCGGDASFNDHTDGCYFTVLRKLKADPPADLSRVPDLIEAWNTRTAIQQAEARTDDPVAYVCPTSHHAHDGSMEDGPDYLEWADEASDYEKRVGTPLYTHPAPGVPVGWPTDAEIEMNIWPLLRLRGHEALTLHDCIAAIRAASPAQKGGE